MSDAEPKSDGSPRMSRRDFLKLGGAVVGTAALVGSGVVARERIIFSNEHKIDMDNYLSKIKVEGRDEWTVNFTTLKLFFPDVVKESEKGGYILKNSTENPIVLDFSNATGKEIRLFPNKTDAAKSNMSWDKTKNSTSFGEVTVGLALEGQFKVKGSIGRPPVFIGDVLDRVITFKGSGKEDCTVEDVAFRGLNAFKQDATGGGDCPDPAFIAGDDVNLEVQGIRIDYTPIKPDWADETNSQLAKGVILHNTENEKPLQMLIAHSVIQGLQWDGICSNGLAEIKVDHSNVIQDRTYKQQRGVGVASTFNNPNGRISISRSTVDYCKGTSIWVNEQMDLPRQKPNMEIMETTINNSGWAISIDGEQKTKIGNLNVAPNYDGESQQDLTYSPFEFNWKGNKFDLSFESLNFKLDSKMGDAIKLMFYGNWEEFSDFSGITPQDFFAKNFGSWGDISAKVKYEGEGVTEVKVTQKEFQDFLAGLGELEKPVNPSAMMLFFDMKTREFVVLFGTELDSKTGTMYFSDPFYLNGVKTPASGKRSEINAVAFNKTSQPEVSVA